MNQFKIRCSAIGQIMGPIGPSESQMAFIDEMDKRTKPMTDKMREKYDKIKSMKPELPEGAKSYCKRWLREQIFGRVEFWSKETEKGNMCEEDAIALLGNYQKNDLHFENEFMTGTPDIITGNTIIDVKCSWDHITFPLYDLELPNNDYWWQVQGYMHLCHKHHGEVSYCLMTTPERLMENPISYDHHPRELRIRTFGFDYNKEAMLEVEERVEMCREYIELLRRDLRLDEF